MVSDPDERHTFMSLLYSSADLTGLDWRLSSDNQICFVHLCGKGMPSASAPRTDTTREMEESLNEWKSVVSEAEAPQ